jgi:hypothetical protein
MRDDAAILALLLGVCACSLDHRKLYLGCADLDTDGVADCKSTLLETPSFTDDVSPWVAVGDAALSWDNVMLRAQDVPED